MKILHTSDWHLGRLLYGKRRYEEFEQFLQWLHQTIVEQEVEALLVAGDIFDTTTPSNKAQEMYYQFLAKVAGTQCKNIVIIAGNHDSPTLLDAPNTLLKVLNITVVGAAKANLEDEIVTLFDAQQKPQALICAVPYLRDRDLRKSEAGESFSDKNEKLIQGLSHHYQEVCALAEKQQAQLGDIPIIGMGHLYTAGGSTTGDDGVRDLYVGTLAHITASAFPTALNYLALGHLHVPQVVGGIDSIRYCGSPIAMGFGEANQKKRVHIVEVTKISLEVSDVFVPVFQELIRVSGDLEVIQSAISHLVTQKSTAWLEIDYTGNDIIGNLREKVESAIGESSLEIIRIVNRKQSADLLMTQDRSIDLEELEVKEVFNLCLDADGTLSKSQRESLTTMFNEIVTTIDIRDSKAL